MSTRAFPVYVLIGVAAALGLWTWLRHDTPAPGSGPSVAASMPTCRTSALASLERTREGDGSFLHVAGEQNPVLPGVEVDVSTSSGSSSSTTFVTLRDPRGGRSVEAELTVAFDRMVLSLADGPAPGPGARQIRIELATGAVRPL